ncbi:MAG: hypothetical protein KC621_00700 [Myxococcales bacterium]|nr:hypothetical protein [Myxococcales bacterium]
MMKPLTPAPVVALFALACIGETSNTHTGTTTTTDIPPMPPPQHSSWVLETAGGSGGHSGTSTHSGTTTAPRRAHPGVSPPPRATTTVDRE